MKSGSMDNFWLVMGVRYGIPGFLLISAGYSWAIFLIMRRDFHGNATLTQFRRAWVFTFLGLSFTLSTVHIWTNIYSFVFFMFGAGMWLILQAAKDPDDDPAVKAPVSDRRPRYSRFAHKHAPKSSQSV
jgi:O-antigen ligase